MSVVPLSKYEEYKELRQQFVTDIRPEYQAHVNKIASDILNDIEETAFEEDLYVDFHGITADSWSAFKEIISDAVLLECSRQPWGWTDPLDLLILSTHVTQAFYALTEYPRDEQSMSLLAFVAFVSDVEAAVQEMIDAANTRRYVPRQRTEEMRNNGWDYSWGMNAEEFSINDMTFNDFEEAWEVYQSGVAHITCSACNGCGEGMGDGVNCHLCRGNGEIEVTL